MTVNFRGPWPSWASGLRRDNAARVCDWRLRAGRATDAPAPAATTPTHTATRTGCRGGPRRSHLRRGRGAGPRAGVLWRSKGSVHTPLGCGLQRGPAARMSPLQCGPHGAGQDGVGSAVYGRGRAPRDSEGLGGPVGIKAPLITH